MLMNKENQKVKLDETDPNQVTTRNISEEETERALNGMICGKAVGVDEMPVEAWNCMCNYGINIISKLLFNCIMNTE